MYTETMLYKDEKGRWLPNKRAALGESISLRVRREQKDIWWYYANLIDYARIVMGVLALVLIAHAPSFKYTIAFLIFGSVLLDWIDGPVARYYGQSTTIGCGWDWLADIMAQYCLAIWCMQVGTSITTFVVIFTGVEMSCGLFDFAISCTTVYPSQKDTTKLPWWAVVEHWLTPNHVYSNLGCACWLANTIYPITYCLQWPVVTSYAMFPLAMLYAWHECTQLAFILTNWQEMSADLNTGIEYQRACTDSERKLLDTAFASSNWEVPAVAAGAPKDRQIFWHNMYYAGKFYVKFPEQEEMLEWCKSLIAEHYPGQKRVIVSFGFINSPSKGSKAQEWHYDYTPTVSNLLIPLTGLTTNNATQFVRKPRTMPMPASQHFPPPHEMLDKDNVNYLEVSQIVARPYSILKMFPSIMHRGIANDEPYDRKLFFLTSNPTMIDLAEGYIQTEHTVIGDVLDVSLPEAKKSN